MFLHFFPPRIGIPNSICSMKPEVGHCKMDLTRFYYDHKTKTCKKFSFGGCGGNENNFETKKDCWDTTRQCRHIGWVINVYFKIKVISTNITVHMIVTWHQKPDFVRLRFLNFTSTLKAELAKNSFIVDVGVIRTNSKQKRIAWKLVLHNGKSY